MRPVFNIPDTKALSISPDGKTLATGGLKNTVKLWDTSTGQEVRSLSGHAGRILDVVFGVKDGALASVGLDGQIKIWQADTGAIQNTLPGSSGAAQTLAFSPDGKILGCTLLRTRR